MAQQPNPTSECAIRRIWVALQCSGEGFNDKREDRIYKRIMTMKITVAEEPAIASEQ